MWIENSYERKIGRIQRDTATREFLFLFKRVGRSRLDFFVCMD